MGKGLLGLEIAERTIRYVYLLKDGGKYRIDKAGEVSSKVDLSVPDALSAELRQILEKEAFSPQRIYATISRRDTVIHQVLFPKMNAGELEEAVSAEITKIPIFFQRNFEYIYKSYPQPHGKNRVVFAAIASSTLQGILKEIRKLNIPLQALDIAPLNLKELLLRIGPARPTEAFLVVNDQHTYLATYDSRQYGIIYKSAVGLNQFISAASPSSRDALIGNWSAEIKRVLKSYLMDHNRSQIDLLWLIWDKARVPELDQKLATDLEVPVEVLYTKKIPGLKIAEEQALNPIYTLAALPAVFAILHLRPQFSFDHFFRSLRQGRYLTQTALAGLLFIVVATVAFGQYIMTVRQETGALVAEKAAMKNEATRLDAQAKTLFQKYENYMAVKQRLLNQATYVQQLNRVSWSEVLSVVAKELPVDLALTTFRLNEDGVAAIEGDSWRMEPVSELLRRVKNSDILKDGKFNFLRERRVKDQKIFNFGIWAKLRNGSPEEKQP